METRAGVEDGRRPDTVPGQSGAFRRWRVSRARTRRRWESSLTRSRSGLASGEGDRRRLEEARVVAAGVIGGQGGRGGDGPRCTVWASRPSRYVSVINDNHLVSLMNFDPAKVN
jgi:hypothetical protein